MGINYTPDQLVFLDESAKDERSLTRKYGNSLINTCARKNVVFVCGKRYTILPALSLQGFIAIDIMEGSCTKERFKNFVIDDVVRHILISIIKYFYNLIYINYDFIL